MLFRTFVFASVLNDAQSLLSSLKPTPWPSPCERRFFCFFGLRFVFFFAAQGHHKWRNRFRWARLTQLKVKCFQISTRPKYVHMRRALMAISKPLKLVYVEAILKKLWLDVIVMRNIFSVRGNLNKILQFLNWTVRCFNEFYQFNQFNY